MCCDQLVGAMPIKAASDPVHDDSIQQLLPSLLAMVLGQVQHMSPARLVCQAWRMTLQQEVLLATGLHLRQPHLPGRGAEAQLQRLRTSCAIGLVAMLQLP